MGDRASALAAASNQIEKCRTDACVLNGPSYGEGFGYVLKDGTVRHLGNRATLCDFLVKILEVSVPIPEWESR